MYVKIGKYKNMWFGPYQIADLLKYVGFSEDTCYDIGEKLEKTFILPLCEWIYDNNPFRKRKVTVKIHPYDAWNLDTQLAEIILPLLKEFKKQGNSSACVENCDVPENIRSYNAPRVDSWDTDEFYHARWEWVLDEEIFAFENILDDSWETQFFGNIEYRADFDGIGHKAYSDRIQNGLRLFGKYYTSHWN